LEDFARGAVEPCREGTRIAMTQPEFGKLKIFADGADRSSILELSRDPIIRGFTTNPTLMRAAGVEDYESFALDVVELVGDRPISLEVFSDDQREMEAQAHKIASWGPNVYVKIPIMNTEGKSTGELLRRLSDEGVKCNVTALMTVAQVEASTVHLAKDVPAFISVFAGRIADTGRDPVPLMAQARRVLDDHPHIELIWASPRELLNVVQAAQIGCHVITATHDILKKLPTLGRALDEYSLDTVRMFHRDAQAARYSL
jgi:transaldolase